MSRVLNSDLCYIGTNPEKLLKLSVVTAGLQWCNKDQTLTQSLHSVVDISPLLISFCKFFQDTAGYSLNSSSVGQSYTVGTLTRTIKSWLTWRNSPDSSHGAWPPVSFCLIKETRTFCIQRLKGLTAQMIVCKKLWAVYKKCTEWMVGESYSEACCVNHWCKSLRTIALTTRCST